MLEDIYSFFTLKENNSEKWKHAKDWNKSSAKKFCFYFIKASSYNVIFIGLNGEKMFGKQFLILL